MSIFLNSSFLTILFIWLILSELSSFQERGKILIFRFLSKNEFAKIGIFPNHEQKILKNKSLLLSNHILNYICSTKHYSNETDISIFYHGFGCH